MKPGEAATVIGKSVVIRGELTGEEDLFLDGELEGSITLPANRLTIGPNARVSAAIKVRDAVVLGKMTGDIHATGSVELRQSANMHGDVFAGRLSIEESAVIKGRVELKARDSVETIKAPVPETFAADAGASFVLEPKA